MFTSTNFDRIRKTERVCSEPFVLFSSMLVDFPTYFNEIHVSLIHVLKIFLAISTSVIVHFSIFYFNLTVKIFSLQNFSKTLDPPSITSCSLHKNYQFLSLHMCLFPYRGFSFDIACIYLFLLLLLQLLLLFLWWPPIPHPHLYFIFSYSLRLVFS